MLRRWILLLAPVALLALGCGEQVGNDGSLVGGPCTVEVDCEGAAICLTGGRYPEGYCALQCSADVACPERSACARDASLGRNVCLVSCAADGDCREGYRCVALPAVQTPGTTRVCSNEPD